jgi:coproporphyrinogen III oxidase-like Fe-S oxidoreductase
MILQPLVLDIMWDIGLNFEGAMEDKNALVHVYSRVHVPFCACVYVGFHAAWAWA